MTCEIINSLPGIKTKSYLELGLGNGRNFGAILAGDKISVDRRNPNADFVGTTDEFFESIKKDRKWDVIFIDANHDLDFVLRDFNNAVKHCMGWVVLHDMIPLSEKYTSARFCSDGFRLLYRLLTVGLEVYPMVGNMGLTFVRMPAKKITSTKKAESLTYAEFVEFIAGEKLYSTEEMKDILCAS